MKYKCITPMFDNTTCKLYELEKVYDIDDKTARRFEEIKCLNRFILVTEFTPVKKKA